MGETKIIAINRKRQREDLRVMYVYGKMLRALETELGGNPDHLFDTHGTPVLDNEYYEITSAGIRRL